MDFDVDTPFALRTELDGTHRASRNLQDVIEDGEIPRGNEWGWGGIAASSERMEAASTTAIANDGWTVNEHGRDDSWDRNESWDQGDAWTRPGAGEQGGPSNEATDRHLLPAGGVSAWETPLPVREAVHTPRHAANNRHETVFRPRRQLPAPSSSSATPPPVTRGLPSMPAATRTTRPIPDPPFHTPSPAGFTPVVPSDFHTPPIGMPNYVYPFGYARSAHIGNGVMHPTAPGPYGLAGTTMVATRNSDWSCTVCFQAGDIITNVVSSAVSANVLQLTFPQIPSTSVSGAGSLQGIVRSRHGTFPARYVRDANPAVYRQLASPFVPARARPAEAAQSNDIGWETGDTERSTRRTDARHAHFSDGEGSDDDDGAWKAAEARVKRERWPPAEEQNELFASDEESVDDSRGWGATTGRAGRADRDDWTNTSTQHKNGGWGNDEGLDDDCWGPGPATDNSGWGNPAPGW